MQYNKNSEQSLGQFEKNLLGSLDRRSWYCSKMSQLISRIATHLAFSSTETLLNLSHYGLTPIVSLSPTQECHRDIETSIPILNGKTVQWQMYLAADSEPVSAFFVKLGTGGRINHCHLSLSLKNNQIVLN
jgi:hypothetical protein